MTSCVSTMGHAGAGWTSSSRMQGARELHDRRIANVMSRGPISVHADTPVEEAADLMHRHHNQAVAGGKMVGIVSRANLMEGLFGLQPRI